MILLKFSMPSNLFGGVKVAIKQILASDSDGKFFLDYLLLLPTLDQDFTDPRTAVKTYSLISCANMDCKQILLEHSRVLPKGLQTAMPNRQSVFLSERTRCM